MPEINYVNPLINRIKNQEIAFQLSFKGLLYTIRSAEDKQCLLLRYYEFKNVVLFDELVRHVEKIMSDDAQLRSGFGRVGVTYISQGSALIPKEFFNTAHLKKYFEFTYTLAELDELHYTFIPCIEAYNVFSLPNYLSQVFYSMYPNVKFNHQASLLIQFGCSLQESKQSLIFIGLNKTFFDIVYFENKRLVLSNSFQYTTSSDLLYFFLYVCRQLKIDLPKINVYVLGEALSEHQYIDEISAYVNEVIIPDITSPSVCRNLSSNKPAQFYPIFLFE